MSEMTTPPSTGNLSKSSSNSSIYEDSFYTAASSDIQDNEKFDITVLGSSGGPVDGVTCSYLIKSSEYSYSQIIDSKLQGKLVCIDSGSGMSQINEIILKENQSLLNESITDSKSFSKYKFHDDNVLLKSYNDSLRFEDYTNCDIEFLNLNCKERLKSSYQLTNLVCNSITEYLITHPHLDHISGFAINSAGFMPNAGKKLFGSSFTIESLKKHLFNGIVWPNLHSDVNGNFFKLLEVNEFEDFSINQDFKVFHFPLNHGTVSDGAIMQTHEQMYESSAFLLTKTKNNKSLLVFGDFETSNLNLKLWDHVADLIMYNRLNGIIIECSTCNVPVNTPLFGHLTPTHLINELIYLSNKIKKLFVEMSLAEKVELQRQNSRFIFESPLKGLNILVSHVKEDLISGRDPRKVILSQLLELNIKHNLGCKFTMVFPGVTYSV